MACSAAAKGLLAATADLVGSSISSVVHRRSLACAASSHGSRIAPYPPDLVRWVRREGGFVHPELRIAGDGLVAAGDIPKGTRLVALPEHLPLQLRWSPDAADVSDRPGSPLFELVQLVPEELWAMRLGLKLLHERAKNSSFWWPYIGNLPEAFNIPIFFSGENIKNLQYAPLIHQVNKRCRFLLDFEKRVKTGLANVAHEDHLFSGQEVTSFSLGWAMSAVSSRAFRLHGKMLQGSTCADVHMLLPLIDMCNHNFQPNALIAQNQKDPHMLVEVVSEIPIEKNTPVTLNYGCLSNDFFLLDYGFVISSNPYDNVELRYDGHLLDIASLAVDISQPKFSSPTGWQREILSRLNLSGDEALLKVNLGGAELIDGRLLAAVRVMLEKDEEAARKCDLTTLKLLSAEAPLGVSTEFSALRILIALCDITLQHFPTKLVDDELLLKSSISDPMKLAVQFRMHKKSVIIDVMRGLTKRVRDLFNEVITSTERS